MYNYPQMIQRKADLENRRALFYNEGETYVKRLNFNLELIDKELLAINTLLEVRDAEKKDDDDHATKP